MVRALFQHQHRGLRFCLDSPAPSSLQYRHSLKVEGWAHHATSPLTEIVVYADGEEIGRTRLLFRRPDACANLGISPDERCGFSISCSLPASLGTKETVEILTSFRSNEAEVGSERRPVRLASTDYRQLPFGTLLLPETTFYLSRANMYAEGPPSAEVSADMVALLLRHLDPGTSVLDVGCGIAPYAAPLTGHGVAWQGCEKRLDFCEHVSNTLGLPCRVVTGDVLPFETGEFDAAIAVEVVEHISEPDPFVAEVARVAKTAAYFSVPNMETLPVYWTYYAVPWHMLIPDHENFFTRFSLKALLQRHFRDVEVFEYGRIPLIDSKEGLPLYNHLFAVARH